MTCEISIARGGSCQNPIIGIERGTSTSSGEVTIDLDRILREMDNVEVFCYNITASIGTEQVVVQDTQPVNTPESNTLVIIIVVLIAIIAILLVIVIINISVIVVSSVVVPTTTIRYADYK